jgi:N-acyl-D-aspartate/D-glutamate deacylase
MHDIVIRNGRIIDGTGAPEFVGDVAIDGDRITAVVRDGEGVVGEGRREIDAAGRLVTPGWIDIHTHMDAQVSWDPYLTPSCYNGVTTVVMGNCGVGFAPVREDDREWLMDLMDAVEDIPATAMAAGITWEWESFPEYLDAIDDKPRVMDIAAQFPHCALRTYVMGPRGADDVQPTDEELAHMRRLVREGIEAGAVGFSSNRLLAHRTKEGELIPGTLAQYPELEAVAEGIEQGGGGVFQLVGPFEREWVESMALEHNLTITYLSGEGSVTNGSGWKDGLESVEEATERGVRIFPQVRGRGTTLLMNLDGSIHPYTLNLAYRELVEELPLAERLEQMRDPEIKAQILASDWDLTNDVRNNGEGAENHPFLVDTTPGNLLPGLLEMVLGSPQTVYVLGDPPVYEPQYDRSVAAHAEREGLPADEAFYDLMTQGDGSTLLLVYLEGYSQGNFDYQRELMMHPLTRNGLSDAGAHVAAVSDAHMVSWNLAYWGRDRTRGDRVPLETIVYKQTGANADLYNLRDRGELTVGKRADVNVIDLERLGTDAPQMVYDLPEGAKRFMQRPTGYIATICAGEVILEDDELTGALPGKLVRAHQTSA